MKEIDILNIIANGENPPKKIKFEDEIYEWNNKANQYYKQNCNYIYLTFETKRLNDEVEVIEEQQDIDIQDIQMFEQEYFYEHEGNISKVEVDLAVKINTIIEYLKQKESK